MRCRDATRHRAHWARMKVLRFGATSRARARTSTRESCPVQERAAVESARSGKQDPGGVRACRCSIGDACAPREYVGEQHHDIGAAGSATTLASRTPSSAERRGRRALSPDSARSAGLVTSAPPPIVIFSPRVFAAVVRSFTAAHALGAGRARERARARARRPRTRTAHTAARGLSGGANRCPKIRAPHHAPSVT